MVNFDLSTLPVAVLVLLGAVIVVHITLAIIALRDLYKQSVEQLVFANKWIWVAIILFVNVVGPILYLVTARKPAVLTENAARSSGSVNTTNIADVLYGPRDDKKQP